MIWRADPWLAELRRNAQSLDAAVAEVHADSDAAGFDLFFQIEKALLLSAFTIRKLHENGEFSSRAEEPLVSVLLHPVRADRKLVRQAIMQFGSVLPHSVCDTSASSRKEIEIRQACNYIIHTCMIAYTSSDNNSKYSFWVLPDIELKKFIEIEIDT